LHPPSGIQHTETGKGGKEEGGSHSQNLKGGGLGSVDASHSEEHHTRKGWGGGKKKEGVHAGEGERSD